MELIYRASTYNRSPDKASNLPFRQVRQAGAAYILNYHALTYRIDPKTKRSIVFVKPAAYELVCRAMTFLVNRDEQGEVTAINSSASRSLKWLF